MDSIPQDLLLIHGLIGDIPQAVQQESVSSSGSETDSLASEDEIEAELMKNVPDDNMEPPDRPLSSSSDSEYSDSDLGPESKTRHELQAPSVIDALEEDEEEEGVATQSGMCLRTKNEITNVPIKVPDIQEVGLEETIEKVGEIMSIVDNVVIVKAMVSENAIRASEKALDSDTLLIFDDRKVLGYVYETFGPTLQPLYQVRFNDTFPLDFEKVRLSREVFHVPLRSHFVFLRDIRRLRGSDASNVHDEEPADEEVEFSDDEAEAAYRQRMKRKRNASRAPSQQHGSYDTDYVIAPSRPPPMPYDDPYSDDYHTASAVRVESRGRGRGRGRGRSRGGGRGRGNVYWQRPAAEETVEPYSPHDPRPYWSGYSQQVVQPHINPRFASAFGLNMYAPPYFQAEAWRNEWGVDESNANGRE